MKEVMTKWDIKPKDFPCVGSIWHICTEVAPDLNGDYSMGVPIRWTTYEVIGHDHEATIFSLTSEEGEPVIGYWHFEFWNLNLKRGFVKHV